MILDPLNNLGLFALLITGLLTFILSAMAGTASWHKITLSDCTVVPGQETLSASWNAADKSIYLYLQPHTGVCWVPNAIKSVATSDCYGWDNVSFWGNWVDVLVGTGITQDDVTTAIDKTMPHIYSYSTATVFFALFPILFIAFHYFKPETLSRFMTQFFCGFFSILVLIFSIVMPASVNANVLQADQNWKQYYSVSGQFVCNDMSSVLYTGGNLSVLNIFLSLGCVMMALFPTFFGSCYKIVDGGGGGGSSSSNNGLSETSSSDIKASLVNGDESQSQYVPPSV